MIVAAARPLGDPIHTDAAFDGTTVIVEAASTCGSPSARCIPAPLAANSSGFGIAVLAALEPRTVALAAAAAPGVGAAGRMVRWVR